jgi:hypothetical protein
LELLQQSTIFPRFSSCIQPQMAALLRWLYYCKFERRVLVGTSAQSRKSLEAQWPQGISVVQHHAVSNNENSPCFKLTYQHCKNWDNKNTLPEYCTSDVKHKTYKLILSNPNTTRTIQSTNCRFLLWQPLTISNRQARPILVCPSVYSPPPPLCSSRVQRGKWVIALSSLHWASLQNSSSSRQDS